MRTPIDVAEVHLFLEEIGDPVTSLKTCERLLSREIPIPSVVFMIDFILTELQLHVNPIRKRELFRHRLGANAAMAIPQRSWISYERLTPKPFLLLEQLLIDIKVEWAGKVFNKMQTELATDENYDEILRNEFTMEAFDDLLKCYATKSLEFKVVTYEERGKQLSFLFFCSRLSLNKRQF